MACDFPQLLTVPQGIDQRPCKSARHLATSAGLRAHAHPLLYFDQLGYWELGGCSQSGNGGLWGFLGARGLWALAYRGKVAGIVHQAAPEGAPELAADGCSQVDDVLTGVAMRAHAGLFQAQIDRRFPHGRLD